MGKFEDFSKESSKLSRESLLKKFFRSKNAYTGLLNSKLELLKTKDRELELLKTKLEEEKNKKDL